MARYGQQTDTASGQRRELAGLRNVVRAGLAVLVLSLAAIGVAVARAGHDGRQAVEAAGQPAPSPDAAPLNTPAQLTGRTGVLDTAGNLRGYTDDKIFDEAMDSGDPVLAVGSGKIIAHGYEVRDESGELTGYLMVPGGFVERSIASDAKAMDSWLADEAKAQAEAKVRYGPAVREMQDKMKEEMLNGR